MDLFWVTKAGADPVAYFEKYPGRFKLWHVKDMDEEGKFAPVGEGTIDFGDYCIPIDFGYTSSQLQAFTFIISVSIDGEPLASNDWVGAFNSDVCVGARMWDTSLCPAGVCDVVLMGDDGLEHTEGYMQNGDIPSFKIYDYSENVYYNAIPSEDIPWQNMAFNVIDSLTVFRDCNGVLGGMAYEDDCGLCDSDPTNDCFYECDLGDVNCDDSLNVLDIVLAANMVLADEYDEIADMNEDGELNILDLVIMVNLVLYGDAGACVDIDGNDVIDQRELVSRQLENQSAACIDTPVSNIPLNSLYTSKVLTPEGNTVALNEGRYDFLNKSSLETKKLAWPDVIREFQLKWIRLGIDFDEM